MSKKIYIKSLGDGGELSAFLPDEINWEMEHRWENPFEVDMSKESMAGLQWVGKQFGGSTGNLDPSIIGDALGIDTFVYMGSTPFTLSLNLEFVVYSDLNTDIINPIKTLVRMASPKAGSTSTLSTLGRPDLVQVSIPDILTIPKAYIQNVGGNLMKPFVTDGDKSIPMRVMVPITILRAEIVTTDRADEMLFN